ncbi:hypothetical protein AcV7_000228 [Taiwanofungus camphoratus]|nr:hypothetical protein AcV7_000228 [Antrodia cinnamomea]
MLFNCLVTKTHSASIRYPHEDSVMITAGHVVWQILNAASAHLNLLEVQYLRQSFPPKSKFSTDQIPDLAERVIIVTGGNVGIGKETVKALLEHNAKVYMASRNKEKAEAAIKELKIATGKEAIFLELDLSNLLSVMKAAEEFMGKEQELHVLFNNAGVMTPPRELVTADGYDLQFGTNVIGHFLFTELLMPALIAGKDTSPDKHARVITTSSAGAYPGSLHWDTFKDDPARRKMTTYSLYYQSKFANVVVARQVAKRYADKGIVSLSCNPGQIYTELWRYTPNMLLRLVRLVLYPAPMGALTQLVQCQKCWTTTASSSFLGQGWVSVERQHMTTCLASACGIGFRKKSRGSEGAIEVSDSYIHLSRYL